jgi:hypothetical protein
VRERTQQYKAQLQLLESEFELVVSKAHRKSELLQILYTLLDEVDYWYMERDVVVQRMQGHTPEPIPDRYNLLVGAPQLETDLKHRPPTIEQLQRNIEAFADEFPEAKAIVKELKTRTDTWKPRSKERAEQLPSCVVACVHTLSADFHQGLSSLEKAVQELADNLPAQHEDKMKAISVFEERLHEWAESESRLEHYVKDAATSLISTSAKKRLSDEHFSDLEKRAFALQTRLDKLRRSIERKRSLEEKMRLKSSTFEEWLVRIEADVDREIQHLTTPAVDINQKRHRENTLNQLRQSIESHEPLVDEFEKNIPKLSSENNLRLPVGLI